MVSKGDYLMERRNKVRDCVEESRKWKQAAARKLGAMTPEERLRYLREVERRFSGKDAKSSKSSKASH